jgi:hypothetical protein
VFWDRIEGPQRLLGWLAPTVTITLPECLTPLSFSVIITQCVQTRSSHGVFLDRTEDPQGFLGWLQTLTLSLHPAYAPLNPVPFCVLPSFAFICFLWQNSKTSAEPLLKHAVSACVQIRSSHGVFLDRTEDPQGFLGWLEERIGAVTMIPPSHGEVCLISKGAGSKGQAGVGAGGFSVCLCGGGDEVQNVCVLWWGIIR